MKPIRKRKKLKTLYNVWKMSEIINLTEDQAVGLKELNEWWKTNDLAICLSGYAGVGKSTLIKEFIRENKLYLESICVSAPTHKAKEVISQITGITTCKTVQELIGLRVDMDIDLFDINNMNFISDESKIKIGSFNLIIIDECSMINEHLFEYLTRFSKKYQTKLLYLGDSFQLNPIKEKISPVFVAIRQIKLTQIVRQKSSNPISELINVARLAVAERDDSFINWCKERVIEDFNVNEGYFITHNKALLLQKFVEYYQTNNNTYFVHYMNLHVEQWNKAIRNELIKDSEKYVKDELIMGYSTIVNKDGDYILQNSVVYKIVKVSSHYINLENVILNYYILDLINKKNEHSQIKVIKNESIKEYKIVVAKKLQHSKNSGSWKPYYNFKEEYLLNESLEVSAGQFVSKGLDYPYCITSHKSQGSTYDYVFVNLLNMTRCKNIIERNRLIYVAVSRASKGIIVLTKNKNDSNNRRNNRN